MAENELREQVRRRYAAAATRARPGASNEQMVDGATDSRCCGPSTSPVDVSLRVLTPGGRVGVSDVVAEDHLTPTERAERGSHTGCIAGALSRIEYLGG